MVRITPSLCVYPQHFLVKKSRLCLKIEFVKNLLMAFFATNIIELKVQVFDVQVSILTIVFD